MPQNSSYYSKIIQLPYRGAPTTVGVIRDSALIAQNDYGIRELAEYIVGDLYAKDYVSEPIALGNYVTAKTRYMRDPRTIELIRDPRKITQQLRDGQRPQLDCDDMTGLLCSLTLSCGCPTRITTVAFRHAFYKGERQYSHVFCQAQDPRSKVWITLDPVAGKKTQEMLRRVVAGKTWSVA